MIFKKGDLEFYKGSYKIPQLGGGTVEGYEEMMTHMETGVVFKGIFYLDGTLDRFVVGIANADGLSLNEQKEWTENSEQSLVDASKYFEELIKRNKEEEEEQPPPPQPPMGTFAYLTQVQKPSYADLSGFKVEIADDDLLQSFYPPSGKPYGLLDIQPVLGNNPQYRLLNAKFALEYNAELTKQKADELGVDVKDIALYDMFPFQTGEGRQEPKDDENGDFPTNPVNKKPNPKDLKQHKGKKPKKEEGHDKRETHKTHQPPTHKGGEPIDLEDKPEREEREEEETSPTNILEALQEMVGNPNIKNAVKGKQENLIKLVNSYTETELRNEFYDIAQLPPSTTKKEFIEIVRTTTNPLFK